MCWFDCKHLIFDLGDHYNKLSVLGCKYRFYPENPVKRKMIRGSILCGKVLAAPLLGSVALVVGAGALAVGCVALPVYGSYKLVKHIKVKNEKQQNNSLLHLTFLNYLFCSNFAYRKSINLKNQLLAERLFRSFNCQTRRTRWIAPISICPSFTSKSSWSQSM